MTPTAEERPMESRPRRTDYPDAPRAGDGRHRRTPSRVISCRTLARAFRVVGSRYRRTPMNHDDAGCGPMSSGCWRHSIVIATDSGRAAGASDRDYSRAIVVSVLLLPLIVAASPVPLSVTASLFPTRIT
jgi:hypothetical protein